MPAKIRLQRVGKKKQPFYRVVVQDRRVARSGKVIELLGHYDPRKEPSFFNVDREKVEKWLKNGAEISDTVRIWLGKIGIMEPVKFKPRPVKPKVEEKKDPSTLRQAQGSGQAKDEKIKETKTEEEKPKEEAKPELKADILEV
jgi:small subunit ribosomal protein S16